jgi:iron complex outermembrane receptor protein
MLRHLMVLLVFAVPLLAAEKDSTRTYLLGEVVVTGRAEVVVRASSVTDLEQPMISLRDALTISSSIALTPGLYLHTNARNESLPTMRGFEPRQVATFLDGVPLSLPYDGTIDLDQLTVAQVAKITTTRGMPSILYGPNSMGGTINIVTQEPGPALAGTARLQGGTRKAGLLSLGSGASALHWYLAGQYMRSDDFPLPSALPPEMDSAGTKRANSATEGFSLFAKLGAGDSRSGRVTASILHTDSPKGVPTNIYTSRPRYWRYTEWKKTVYTLAGESLLGSAAGLKATLFYQTYYNVLDSYDDATFTTQNARYAFHSTYDDYSFGGTLVASVASPVASPLKLLASARRDVHGEQASASSPFARFAAETYSVGLEQEAQINEFGGVLGLSLDFLHPSEANGSELRGSAHTWGGHAGVVYQVSPLLSLHGHLSHRSRFPTLKELYSENLGLNLPNPDLGPERTWNVETGLAYAPARAAEFRLALYYSDVRGLIQNVFLSPTTRQLQNLGKAVMTGLECSGRVVLEYHTFEANYTFLVAENRTAAAPSQNLEHRPRHVATLAVDRLLPAHAALRAEAHYVSSRYSVDLDDGSWETLGGYWTVNLRGGIYLLPGLEVFGRVDNVTDTYYESEYGYPQPGRTFTLGVQGSF